jgi:hypothetical protein
MDLPRIADLAQRRVGEEVVLPLGERTPGLNLHAALAHELLLVGALVERVRLDLVDRRDDLVVVDEVDQPVGEEVRHADGLREPFAVELLHRAPLAVVVAVRLVDEVEVHVIEAQPLQRRVDRALGVLLAGILDPQLGGDEQLLARDAALLDGPPHGLLVAVRGGGVEGPVARGEGVGDRLLCLLVRDPRASSALLLSVAVERHAAKGLTRGRGRVRRELEREVTSGSCDRRAEVRTGALAGAELPDPGGRRRPCLRPGRWGRTRSVASSEVGNDPRSGEA